MGELEEDRFQTFIAAPPTPQQSLDIQKMQVVIVKEHNFSLEEFWQMPLSLVFEVLGMFVSPKKKPMSRKTLVDNERLWNYRNGY